MAIKSWKDRRLSEILDRKVPKGFPADLARATRRKLILIDAASVLDDLKAPPGNRLEALEGERSGQHSIRVNSQFRLCFVWTSEGPTELEFVDYH